MQAAILVVGQDLGMVLLQFVDHGLEFVPILLLQCSGLFQVDAKPTTQQPGQDDPDWATLEIVATLLAVALPNPFIRVPSKPSPNLLRVAGVVERRARAVGSARARCVLGN